MKARKPAVKAKPVKPTPADLKAMKEKIKANIAAAQVAFNIAENRFDEAEEAVESAQAELECQGEFLDDAENDLEDAKYDLEEFNDLVQYAKDFDDWKHVINFKASYR